MEESDFKQLVARLERESAQAPLAYKLKVAGLALIGVGVLAVFLGTLGLGFVLLAAALVALAFSGGGAVILALKFGKLLLFVAVPFWYLLRDAVRALFVRLPTPEGRELRHAEAPELFAALDTLRRRMKGPRFHHVLLVDALNAAVVQRPAFGLVGWPRNYLILGLPLLECFTPQEALVVVAHEYGHLANAHGRFSAFIYRLRLTWGTLQAYADNLQGWLAKLARPVVDRYVPYFNAYTFVLARANEYQADAASARLVGAAHAARALKRVGVMGACHDLFLENTFKTVGAEPQPPTDLMQRWAATSARPLAPADATRWLQQALDREPGVWDTHPTLRTRIAALAQDEAAAGAPPPVAGGDTAAQRWFGAGLDTLRAEMQQRWVHQVEAPWTQRHQELRAQRERLDALSAQEVRDADEELERINLTLRLQSDADLRPDLTAFNAAHPQRAAGWFLHGVVCLDAGDAQGLEMLDRAMDLDAAWTKPACERAHAFLTGRNEAEAAERYAKRWRDRDAHDAQVRSEWLDVKGSDTMLAPQLDAATLEHMRALAAAAGRKHVKAVHVARRVLPSDAQAVQYVVGVTLTWWGSRSGRPQKVADRFAALEWPVTTIVLTLNGRFHKAGKKLVAVGERLA